MSAEGARSAGAEPSPDAAPGPEPAAPEAAVLGDEHTGSEYDGRVLQKLPPLRFFALCKSVTSSIAVSQDIRIATVGEDLTVDLGDAGVVKFIKAHASYKGPIYVYVGPATLQDSGLGFGSFVSKRLSAAGRSIPTTEVVRLEASSAPSQSVTSESWIIGDKFAHVLAAGPGYEQFSVTGEECDIGDHTPPFIAQAEGGAVSMWCYGSPKDLKMCAECRLPQALYLCARCRRVRYCNKTCQTAHYEPLHKAKCRRRQPRTPTPKKVSGGSASDSSLPLVPFLGVDGVD